MCHKIYICSIHVLLNYCHFYFSFFLFFFRGLGLDYGAVTEQRFQYYHSLRLEFGTKQWADGIRTLVYTYPWVRQLVHVYLWDIYQSVQHFYSDSERHVESNKLSADMASGFRHSHHDPIHSLLIAFLLHSQF